MNDPIFGIHSQALKVQSTRHELLARNLAHADTPGYLARDIDFKAALSDASSSYTTMRRTHTEHLAPTDSQPDAAGAMKYRLPTQPSVDGNTVEADIEQAQFAENVVRYRASLSFIDGRIRSLRHAISGER